MTTTENGLSAEIIRVTEMDVALALSRVQQPGDDIDPWENWQQLPEERRQAILQHCRSRLMAQVDLTSIWEQALLADNLKERWGEELDIKPARLEEDRRKISDSPRLACIATSFQADSFIPINPVNQNVTPEGTFEDWVSLARAILEESKIQERVGAEPEGAERK